MPGNHDEVPLQFRWLYTTATLPSILRFVSTGISYTLVPILSDYSITRFDRPPGALLFEKGQSISTSERSIS